MWIEDPLDNLVNRGFGVSVSMFLLNVFFIMWWTDVANRECFGGVLRIMLIQGICHVPFVLLWLWSFQSSLGLFIIYLWLYYLSEYMWLPDCSSSFWLLDLFVHLLLVVWSIPVRSTESRFVMSCNDALFLQWLLNVFSLIDSNLCSGSAVTFLASLSEITIALICRVFNWK